MSAAGCVTGCIVPAGGADEPACPPCPTLPSSETAFRVVYGDPASIVLLLRDWALRSALCGIGIALFGDTKHLVRNSLACGAGIEMFVLGWVGIRAWQRGDLTAPQPAAPRPLMPRLTTYPPGAVIR